MFKLIFGAGLYAYGRLHEAGDEYAVFLLAIYRIAGVVLLAFGLDSVML